MGGFHNKKGQVTLFIILGLLIIIFFGIYYYQLPSTDISSQQLTPEQTVITQYVESCLQDTAQNAVRYVAKRGGYFELSEYNVRYIFEGFPLAFDIPYYLYETKNTMPSLEQYQDSIDQYIEQVMPLCLQNMSEVIVGTTIRNDTIDATTQIYEGHIEVALYLPVILTEENSQQSVDTFTTSFSSSLYSLYSIAEEINTQQKEAGDTLCLSCLLEYENNGIDVSLNDFVGDDNLYILFFKLKEKNVEDPLLLLFAQRYLLGETAPLSIEQIPDQNITVGYEYSYQVNAKGNNVTYSDETDLFDISPTGLIQFTPTLNDLGSHLIKIGVEDQEQNTDAVFFELQVLDAVPHPVLEYIDSFVAYVGEPFEYTITATDPQNYTLYYYDDSKLFDVNAKTGKIAFTPTASDVGSYTVTLSAVNEMGGVDTQEVDVIIIS